MLDVLFSWKKDSNSQDEQKKDDESFIDNKKYFETVQQLIHGSYFRIPQIPSIFNVMNVFASPTEHEFTNELFILLTKQNLNSKYYTHLQWNNTRLSAYNVNDTNTNSVPIHRILSISVNTLISKNDKDTKHVFFLKIRWTANSEQTALVLQHFDLNHLWYFAKALIYACKNNGINISLFNRLTKMNNKHPSNNFNIFCGTYNVGAAKPKQTLHSWLQPQICSDVIPDFYAITFQEIIDLGSTDLLIEHHQSISWEYKIYEVISPKYIKIESVIRGGLVLFLFAKKTIIHQITNIKCDALNVGLMGAPNKAAVGIKIEINNKINISFIAFHLDSGAKNTSLRNENFWKIYRNLTFADGNIENKNDIIYLFGDLNYRLQFNKLQIFKVYNLIQKVDIDTLLKYDQLMISQKKHQSFIGFQESKITFLPTYKYVPGSNKFDNRKNYPLRIPSYTDRILYKSLNRNINITAIKYNMNKKLVLSDHKPVYALFTIEDCDIKKQLDKKKLSLLLHQQLENIKCQQNKYNETVVGLISQLETGKDLKATIETIEKFKLQTLNCMNSLSNHLKSLKK